jgi:hypothetical protein
MSDNPFSERYTQLSNTALLKILSRAGDYQPLAVETAKAELKSRQLSETALEEAKQELEKERLLEQENQERIQAFENKVKAAGTKLFDNLNPVREKASSPGRIINIICLLLLLGYLYSMIKEYSYFHYLLFETSPSLFVILSCLAAYLYTPLTAALFWKRKKAGWLLLAIYISSSIFTSIVSLRQYWKLQGIAENMSLSRKLFPEISLGPILLGLAFYITILFLICRPRLRVFYKVRKKLMFGVIGLTSLILLLIVSVYGG